MGAEHVESRRGFEAWFIWEGGTGLGLVDSFRVLHEGERGYRYWPRGREWGINADRVDLVLVSGEVGMVQAGMLDNEVDGGSSDHVLVFVGLRW